MYDELVKRLKNRRICIQQSGSLDDFPLLGEAADAIEELSKPKWIPVTERLPVRENDGYYVLVCEEDGDIMLASYTNGEWFLRDMYEIIELKPTHWMPLPEPPKEE